MAERDLLTSGLMIKTTGGNAIQNPLVGTANKAASDMVDMPPNSDLPSRPGPYFLRGCRRQCQVEVRRPHRQHRRT